MSLKLKIDQEYKNSLKMKDIDLTNTIRLIKSAIKDKEIQNRTSENSNEMNDQQILALLQNLIKQRNDSIDSFKQGNREDLIEKEEKEIQIIKKFLPSQLTEDEVKKIINDFILSEGTMTIKDMGKIMNFLKSNHAGKVDMALAGKITKELLINK